MWHLVLSELIRFRSLAVPFAVAHFLLLRFLGGSALFVPSILKLMLGALLYSLIGLIFGLYQIGSYRRRNQWAYLVHRPMAPRRIFLALSAAAGLLLTAVVVMPLVLMTVYVDFMTHAWVDGRHYLLPLFVFGLVLSFYWVGSLIALSASRAAFLVGLLPILFLNWQGEGLWIFVPQFLVVAWLGYLVASAFKPDLSRHVARPLAVMATAISLQVVMLGIVSGVVMIALQAGAAYQRHGWRSLSVQDWSTHFADGTYEAASYAREAGLFRHGLAESSSPRSAHLLNQVALADIHGVHRLVYGYPRRHQLYFMDKTLTLNDEERGVQWTFSHDRMMFYGQDAQSGVPVGWLGTQGVIDDETAASANGDLRFPGVPRTHGNRYVMTDHQLFEFDAKRQRIDLRFALPPGERLLSALEIHTEFATVLSDQRLYFFEPRDLARTLGAVSPVTSLVLPGKIDNLHGLVVAELIDSYAVSFLFGTQSERGFGPARLIVTELAVAGDQVTSVATRDLDQGWSDAYRYRKFILAPLLHVAHEVVWSLVEPRGTLVYGSRRSSVASMVAWRPPSRVLVWTLLLSLASAGLTAWYANRRLVTSRQRMGWTIASLLLGVPCFLSFLFLTDRRERPAPAPRRGRRLGTLLRETA